MGGHAADDATQELEIQYRYIYNSILVNHEPFVFEKITWFNYSI